MNNIVIQVENVSKQYRLGQVGRRSLSQDVNRWWHTIRGKENPYLKIGQENDRTSKSNGDYVWVLRDINFQVNHGEVLGVIGRNGAGKSTLLKLLSKVTSPTEGQIKIKGRIASLLEVGTGFHPELSGRDNIFLNGAILGMNRKEIASKFDAIVDFAGVEKYIDTPVKRYSSGMYVRLAFAVAAHLEPDILIVDEVLAVGDAEFQKKCLGKMKDVSEKEGRTVLFVSHNMDSISRLCKKVIVLEKGQVTFNGNSNEGVSYYLKGENGITKFKDWYGTTSKPGNENISLLEVKVTNAKGDFSDYFYTTEAIIITMKYQILRKGFEYTHGFNLYNEKGVHILSSHDTEKAIKNTPADDGFYEASVTIPANFLSEGYHYASIAIMSYDPYIVHLHELEAVSFLVKDAFVTTSARGVYGGFYPGVVRPLLEWESNKLNIT